MNKKNYLAAALAIDVYTDNSNLHEGTNQRQ